MILVRKIAYISGTRADFGLMQSTLEKIQQHPEMELAILVTGMHLSGSHGHTVCEIEAAKMPIAARIPLVLEPTTGATMARNIGKMLIDFVDILEEIRPDILLLLGDRGEMLAGAIAAIHLNIPVVHIHGGERSGTVDEPIRHAISKMAHFHFVATVGARNRLIQMGEKPSQIWVTGAPGLDGLIDLADVSRESLLDSVGLDAHKPVALMVYHPVLQEADLAGVNVCCVLDALEKLGVQVIALMPNSDAGSASISKILKTQAKNACVRVIDHLPRKDFVCWMASVDFMIGNSSSGIIEAASFGTPVINIGSRQNLRERNDNIIDVPVEGAAIVSAIETVLGGKRISNKNVYGDGLAGERIVSLLGVIPLTSDVLHKTNVY